MEFVVVVRVVEVVVHHRVHHVLELALLGFLEASVGLVEHVVETVQHPRLGVCVLERCLLLGALEVAGDSVHRVDERLQGREAARCVGRHLLGVAERSVCTLRLLLEPPHEHQLTGRRVWDMRVVTHGSGRVLFRLRDKVGKGRGHDFVRLAERGLRVLHGVSLLLQRMDVVVEVGDTGLVIDAVRKDCARISVVRIEDVEQRRFHLAVGECGGADDHKSERDEYSFHC